MEREKLCTDFGELRAGALIRIKCNWCTSSHRGVLVNGWTGPVIDSDGNVAHGRGWELFPAACQGETFVICKAAVDNRRVYIIDTGAEDSTPMERTRKRPVPARAR